MKMQQKKFLLVFVVLLFVGIQFPINMYGQVTIGSNDAAQKAALLEVKSTDAVGVPLPNPTSPTDPNNVTSDKGGIGLPRVQLVDITTLDPFINSTSDADWLNPAKRTEIKMKHAGLMVYNIYVSPKTVTDPDKKFKQGTYVWDGEQWKLAGDGQGKKWFYMPAFNLPLPKISEASDPDFTYDLYEEYRWQFTSDRSSMTGKPAFISNATMDFVPSPETDRLYTRDELDFVVTYYDADILTVTGIQDGTSGTTRGMMTYKIKDNDPGNTSFINVVFVIKDN